MFSRPSILAVLGAAFACSGLAVATAHAASAPVPVQFETVDEVVLHGTYFPSDKGDKAPCAVLLPPIGGSSQHPALMDLAAKLQAKGYAVLTFDFRGHGNSTQVSQFFWNVSASKSIKGANPKKTDINVKEFPSGYLPILVNDIAAAVRFLDMRNDAGECNTSNIVVIGARESALLGAMWIAADGNRRAGRQGGNSSDIVGAVWLSFTPSLGGVPNAVDKWMGSLRLRTPMAFLYGEDDKAAAGASLYICNNVLKVDTPPRPRLTKPSGIKSKASGLDLLNDSLNDQIVTELENIVAERGGRPWIDRNTKKDVVDFIPLKGMGYSVP